MSERELWQHVIHRALLDATATTELDIDYSDRRDADEWIRGAGRDFQMACDLADWTPEFVAEKYRAGKIDPRALRSGRFGKKHLHGGADGV